MKILTNIIVALAMGLLAACSKTATPTKPADVDYYTCTMHTSVHAEAPGKCPVCGMELVPVKKNTNATPSAMASPGDESMQGMAGMPGMQRNQTTRAPSREFVVPVERQQQIGVTYARVQREHLRKEIRAVGTVEYDSQKHWAFVARADGYVQQLFVASVGEVVQKDQPLLSIYSPDLATTERELVMLLRMRDEARTAQGRETPARLIAAAEARLQQWNITPEQIAELEKNRNPSDTITLSSPFHGVVQELPAHQGVNVKMGDHLVDVADLSTVWVWADFYETELSVLKAGQAVTITSKSFPDAEFTGTIAVVNPFIGETNRTSKVRIDIPNPDFKLRPGMYANVDLAIDAGSISPSPRARSCQQVSATSRSSIKETAKSSRVR